ncbi:putative E3 Ubiquitin-Protein Ligase Triml1 [Manis pentadactyla]|nr:putative E3 Ubiquitin-Protein Ligase Triml1 [Manis pentadactyla]
MSFFEKMSTADLMETFREELTCFICLDYFNSPVTTECGHSFCLVCLLRSWEEHSTPLSCPECWRALETPYLQPNERLERLAAIVRQLRSQVLHSEGEPGSSGKTLADSKVFSDEEQGASPFSTQCPGVNRGYLSHEAEEHLKEETKACKQVVVSEYVKMHQLLKEEEQLQLLLLEEEERENLKKLRDSEIVLTQQLRSLSKMIGQMESTCHNSISKSFEDVRGTVERGEALLLQCPEATTMELTLCRVTGMREMLRKFSTDVTLDPATASACLILSEDLKSVRHGGIRQQLPDSPERFDQCAMVLGAQSFTCGRHYWEVAVGSKTEWEDILTRSSQCFDVGGLQLSSVQKYPKMPDNRKQRMFNNSSIGYYPLAYVLQEDLFRAFT